MNYKVIVVADGNAMNTDAEHDAALNNMGACSRLAEGVVERYRLIDYEDAREAWERGGRENSRGGAVGEGWAPDPNYKG